ncbi:type VI secretion system protein TssL, long form [Thiorhodovibrio frisius]|uniref:Type VI secretion system OmpA/MotB family protein n=2 Tax=Thiorhodovibrio frisius TaxID=631362 RepID=H8Z3G6_9GAMM|nr:type VI secretion system protein TssL, long form [Thiorhodovibrio frisius]EIC21874.1 type VI secretion system OmpA/MotB family protein [Thiorhodovibrio frisius]WPL24163.1 Chemotaxis protein MotB [Thiorhodovibrio frisius]
MAGKAAECPKGLPGWMATFADLMALLLCFFVLLLSFSEMDVHKYKQIAGSMKMAFGVQREVDVQAIPKGTTVISPDFSPGKPTPTLAQELRQQTTDESKTELGPDQMRKELEAAAQEIAAALQEEIEQGLIDVEVVGEEILIRIREKGSFASGSARLQDSFSPILDKIAETLSATEGSLIVAGHTDDVPINTMQFPSNWVLSAARAAAVVHHITEVRPELAERMQIRAHGDTRPVATNDTPEGRAENRRVEIVIARKKSDEEGRDITGDAIDIPYRSMMPPEPEAPLELTQ